MKTKILIFAAIALMLGIAIPSCLKQGEDTIVLEGSGVIKDNPTPDRKSGFELGNVTFKPNQPSEATLQKIARKR